MPRHDLKLAGLVLGMALLPAIAWSASGPGWHASLFPEAIRSRIFLSAFEVKPFPLRDSTFYDPRAWPRSTTFAGKDTVDLQVWRDSDSLLQFIDTSAPGFIPGQSLNQSYVKRGSHRLVIGPDYVWNKKGQLIQMVWHQPDPSEEYEYRYDPSGRLRTYRHSTFDNPTSRQRVSTIVEVFDGSGVLKGVHWEQANKGSMYWWEGKPVKSLEWGQKRKALG